MLKLFAHDRYLSFHAPDKHSAEPIRESKALRVFDLPIKAQVDLLLEPIETNRERYEYLKDLAFPSSERRQKPVYAVDRSPTGVQARLNLGAAGTAADGQTVHVRSDYIGLEVDRFFRLSGSCRPLLLSVGETLMSLLDHGIHAVSRELDHIGVKIISFGQPSGMRKYVIKEHIPPTRMKGVSHAYDIYHLFGENSLGKAAYSPQTGIESLMEPTRAFIAEHGFYAIKPDQLLP